MQQVGDQKHRHQAGGDAEQLKGQIEPWPIGSDRAVEHGVLSRQRLSFDGEVVDQAEEGPERARAETDRQHDPDLVRQRPSPAWRGCYRVVEFGCEHLTIIDDAAAIYEAVVAYEAVTDAIRHPTLERSPARARSATSQVRSPRPATGSDVPSVPVDTSWWLSRVSGPRHVTSVGGWVRA